MDAISYLGFSRETENIIKDITEEDIILGYKLVPCPECLGTGVWDFAPYISIEECVVCKGTGKVYINV